MTRSNLVLAFAAMAAGLVIALVWVPLDTDTGLIYKARRQIRIGDALAPTVAAAFVGLGGVLLLLQNLQDTARITRANLGFVLGLLALFVVSTALMLWTGPAAVALFAPDHEGGYRLLRDTAPWKYLGFILGGTVLVSGLIAAVEHRVSLRALGLGLAAVLVMIAIYDLPFDDLLLPPNGDF